MCFRWITVAELAIATDCLTDSLVFIGDFLSCDWRSHQLLMLARRIITSTRISKPCAKLSCSLGNRAFHKGTPFTRPHRHAFTGARHHIILNTLTYSHSFAVLSSATARTALGGSHHTAHAPIGSKVSDRAGFCCRAPLVPAQINVMDS